MKMERKKKEKNDKVKRGISIMDDNKKEANGRTKVCNSNFSYRDVKI
jgi:hypothetical protein